MGCLAQRCLIALYLNTFVVRLALAISHLNETDREITDGQLTCGCGRTYKIHSGVPVLLAEVSEAERFTAKNFGEQWSYFHQLGGLGNCSRKTSSSTTFIPCL